MLDARGSAHLMFAPIPWQGIPLEKSRMNESKDPFEEASDLYRETLEFPD